MPDIKPLFGILASLFILLGVVPYLRDIYHKKAHPHVLSWLGWGFVLILGGSAMYAEGSTWVVAIILSNSLLCFSVAFYSAFKKVGVWSTGIQDYILFGLGILGLILWQTLDMPALALVCAIVADLSFGIPTIIKTHKDPFSETPFVWMTATTSGFLSLFAIYEISFHEVAYPLYLFIFDATVLSLALRKKPKWWHRKPSSALRKDSVHDTY